MAMQVTEFQVVTSEFLQRLKTTGPGLPNTDLAKGLELLKKFQVLQQPHRHKSRQCNMPETACKHAIKHSYGVNQASTTHSRHIVERCLCGKCLRLF